MWSLTDLFAAGVAFMVGFAVQRYFAITSAEKKTNIPFIKRFNVFFGSKDIVFEHDKIMAVNAHDRHQELGDTFGCFFNQKMQIFCRDPDLIYKICVTDFQKFRNRLDLGSPSPELEASLMTAKDNAWQTSRRAVGSVLKASKLKMDNVDTELDLTCKKLFAAIDRRLQAQKAQGQETLMDVYQINKNFFMQAILKTIYDTDDLVDFDDLDHNDVVEEMHKFINVNYEQVARIVFHFPVLIHLLRLVLHFFDHGKYLNELTTRLEGVLKREAAAAQKGEVRGRLTTIHSLIHSYRKGELTRRQLVGNAFFMMMAGFATSVDTMSALLWHLAQNPEVQSKLRLDLQQYGEGSKYLEQCINETLRLFPGSLTNRTINEDVYYKDHRLVKGLNFNISIYSTHRHPKYWGPDPDTWRPDRFDPANVAKFHAAQFIPFGIGPRNCVGYHLAKLELTKLTSQFILRYKLEPSQRTQKKLEFVPLGALPFALPIQSPIFLRLTPVNA